MTVPVYRAVDQHGKSGASSVLAALAENDRQWAELEQDNMRLRAEVERLEGMCRSYSDELHSVRLDLADAKKQRRGW